MKTNWSDLIRWRNLLTESQIEAGRTFQLLSPITDEEIQELESKLNVEIPYQLLSLYSETNGINELFENMIIDHLIWSSTDIIERNLEMRSCTDFKDLYMPFDCLLFFAGEGNGDLFGIPILNGKCPRYDIFHWNHEDDSRTWIANNLFQFLEKRIKGELEI